MVLGRGAGHLRGDGSRRPMELRTQTFLVRQHRQLLRRERCTTELLRLLHRFLAQDLRIRVQ